jgi:CRISPR-associated protein Cmr1
VADWLRAGYNFGLDLRYPAEVAEQVESALQWWISFGGIGARSRRGFGSVHCAQIASATHHDVAKRGGRLIVSGSGGTRADTEWKIAIDRLYSFRQKGGVGRGVGAPPRAGRSFWPEPDQIRRFTDVYLPIHKPVHGANNLFPRAAFGLPITFKFYSPAPENYAVELVPDGSSERMASPLILRPYWNDRNWQPAALLLPGWEKALVQPLKFKNKNYAPAHWPTDPASRQKAAKEIQPMQGRANDPLSAFMQFFEKGN